MIESKVLGKNYKTKSSYKTQITKYQNVIKADYNELSALIKKGWRLYLGESIFRRKNDLRLEYARILRERNTLLGEKNFPAAGVPK